MTGPRLSLRARFLAWSGMVALLLAAFAGDVLPHLHFETNILALLPPSQKDQAEDRALDRFSDLLGRNLVYLIGAPDFATARKAAAGFAHRLEAAPDAFEKVRFEIDANALAGFVDAYAPYRDRLLAPRARAMLAAGEDDALLEQARQSLYTPAAFLRRSAPGTDPLNLFGDFMAQALPTTGQLGLRESVLSTQSGTPPRQYVLVSAVLSGNPFSTDEQKFAAPVLQGAIAEAQALGASVDGSGLLQHAIAASQMASGEVNLFGGVQFLGLVIVLWWVFRSLRVLLLAGATLAIGVIAALTVSHYVFDRLHVLTLVFCSNLAGVAIDYCIYFCADQFRSAPAGEGAARAWNPVDAVRHIGPAITMSAAAAVLSYALLAVAPFPGLRQAALFCCVGLIGAYGCVMGWFPRWVRPAPAAAAARRAAGFVAFDRFRGRLSRRTRLGIALLAAAVALGGIVRVHFADDVRVLQPSTPLLIAQEKQVRDTVGGVPDARFYLVRAASTEAVLEAEEALRAKLDPLVAAGRIGSYTAISTALPSLKRQTADRSLLAQRVYSADGLAPRFMRELGFDETAIGARRQQFAASDTPLLPDAWLRTPAADPYRHQWLGQLSAGEGGAPPLYGSIVTLSAVADAPVFRDVAEGLPEVRFIDRISEYSSVLQRYRERALLLVAAAAVASALLLSLAYGLRQGFQLMGVPCAACLATLGLFGWAGTGLTFFNVVALHLVMGLGMEYSILLQLPSLDRTASLLSATLAAALALLAFGLLALSATPFIHSVGLTVSIGVICGFVFAFLAGRLTPKAGPETAPERSWSAGASS